MTQRVNKAELARLDRLCMKIIADRAEGRQCSHVFRQDMRAILWAQRWIAEATKRGQR